MKHAVRVATFVLLAAVAVVSPASAQLSPAGATTLGASPFNNNAVAYDNVNGVYLHVYCYLDQVYGRFMDRHGALVGDIFRISAAGSTFAGWPRVAFSSGGSSAVFLVTYSDNRTRTARPEAKNLWGQIVSFNGTGGQLVGASFGVSAVSDNAGIFQEGGKIAYNPTTNQFLVPWDDSRSNWEVYARLIGADGSYGSGEVNVSGLSNWQGQSSATYDWQTHQFAVTFAGDEPSGVGIYAQILDGVTAQPTISRISIRAGTRSESSMMPTVNYLADAGKFLVAWQFSDGSGFDVVGRFVAPDGSLGSQYPLVATGAWDGTPDGACNWASNTCVFVGQHDPPFAIGVVTDSLGNPTTTFRASTVNASRGTYQPMLASAWDQPQYALGYNIDYVTMYADRWTATAAATPGLHPGGGSPPPPPPPPPPQQSTLDIPSAPNGSWVFAEGAVGLGPGFSTYYSLANENASAITVRAWFLRESDRTTTFYETSVPAQTRVTLDLSSIVSGVQGSYAAVFQSVTTGQQVYVARTMYWNAGGGILTGGGHEKAGTFVPSGGSLSTTWFFAEGTRVTGPGGLFDTYVMVANPYSTAATVTIDFIAGGGGGVLSSQVQSVPAYGRWTVSAAAIAALTNKDFSIKVTSSGGVVAERSMYWGTNWSAGHVAMGAPSLATDWFFAEGTAMGNFGTYYLLMNPTSSPVSVTSTYLLSPINNVPQSPVTVTRVLPANSRTTVYLGTEVGGTQTGVASEFHANGTILVERSMYWGTGWTEGSTVMATSTPAVEWHLAEGSTRSGFETYVLLSNPNTSDVNVNVTTFSDAGTKETNPVTIPAKSRVTLWMNNQTPANGPVFSTIAANAFSTKVSVSGSSLPIVVEQAVYWGRVNVAGEFWRGGDATMGSAVVR